MSFHEMLEQYVKCYNCEHFGDCPDAEKKIKEALAKPMIPAPIYTNPLNPNTPYKSKYFDDHRFDPPKELTGDDIKRAMERMKDDY